MIRTYLLLGILLVGLVGAAGAVTATESPEAVCADLNESGQTVVGMTPAEVLGPDTSTTLYPESELRVLVCEDGEALDREDGETWDMTDQEGVYTVEEKTERSVHIKVSEPDSLDLQQQIDGLEPDSWFTVQSPSDRVYESQLLDSEIRLGDDDGFEGYEETVQSAIGYINELNDELERERDDLSQDADAETVREYRETLVDLETNRTAALANITGFETALYEQTLNHPQPENPTQSMMTLQEERTTIDEQTTTAASESIEQLEEIERELQSTVRRNVGLGMAGGLLAGILVGVIGPWRKGKEVDDFYQVSSKNTFTTDVLKLPWLVGGLLLVGGLAAMVWLGIAGVII